MKKLLSTAIATTLTATGLLATSATLNTAAAEVAFNAGVMSQYIFRGVTQRDGASIMGGADYTHKSGLYLGTWFAQVGNSGNLGNSQGLEIDVYGGYNANIGDLGLGAGFTSYQYTDKITSTKTGFDTSYNELNFKASYGPFTATLNPGYREATPGTGSKDAKYLFSSVKAEFGGFYGLYGHWDWDSNGPKDGNYLQAGYKTSLGGMDLEAAVVRSSKELNVIGAKAGIDEDTRMFFSASKSF